LNNKIANCIAGLLASKLFYFSSPEVLVHQMLPRLLACRDFPGKNVMIECNIIVASILES